MKIKKEKGSLKITTNESRNGEIKMINNVTLVGRLTKDPDLRYTASGTAVATFTLAVNRNFTNQNGNREADFVNCVIWRKPAETMATLAKKGSLIGVVGRIQTRTTITNKDNVCM